MRGLSDVRLARGDEGGVTPVRVAIGLALLVLVGCGGGSATYRAATLPEAKKLMIDYLDGKQLTYHWVACLRTGRSFHDAAIIRCNVNFGDPHIEAYCIVLRDGKFESDHQDPAIPCHRDHRATPAAIVSS
jgi:hypothetical protein